MLVEIEYRIMLFAEQVLSQLASLKYPKPGLSILSVDFIYYFPR
jgi:hypothetical protein